MEGRQVTFAYSLMILVMCCGYSEPSEGFLLNLTILPAIFLISSALYSVYWLKRHTFFTISALFGSFLNIHLFSYTMLSISWYFDFQRDIGPFLYELTAVLLSVFLSLASYYVAKKYCAVNYVLNAIMFASLFTESVFVLISSDYATYLPWIIYSVALLSSVGLVFLFRKTVCKILLPILASYVITLTVYIQHLKTIINMDLDLLPVLYESTLKRKPFSIEQLQSVWDKFAELDKIAKLNSSEKVLKKLL